MKEMENKCDIVEGGVVPWRSSLWGESVFRIGSGGMKPVETGKMPMTVGVMYPLGASSSPDIVLLTTVTPKVLRYKSSPWTKDTREGVIDRRIGEDLIYKGTRTYLKFGWKDDLSKSLRSMLRGGKGKKEDLADFEKVVFSLTAADGKGGEQVDLWRHAEKYGSVGGLENPKTGKKYYEVRGTAGDLKAAKQDKLFRVVKVVKGWKRIGLPESRQGMDRVYVWDEEMFCLSESRVGVCGNRQDERCHSSDRLNVFVEMRAELLGGDGRNGLFEGKVSTRDFKRGDVSIMKKQLKGYVLDHIGIAQVYGRRWMVIHLPKKSLISATNRPGSIGDFKKLSDAKRFAHAALLATDRYGIGGSVSVGQLRDYGEYVYGGGGSDISKWMSKN